MPDIERTFDELTVPGLIRCLPREKALTSFLSVDASGNSVKMMGIVKIIGKGTFFFTAPLPSAGVVGFFQ